MSFNVVALAVMIEPGLLANVCRVSDFHLDIQNLSTTESEG
jgi:hypothetical protein